MKAKIIAVANRKGGVGKTSSVATIGAVLASKGKKILLVDLDTQANLTRHFLSNIPARIIYHAIRSSVIFLSTISARTSTSFRADLTWRALISSFR